MMGHRWLFKPIDSWFFRDSTPFEAGVAGRGELKTMFPPSISTLQGAIRTALAYGQGWIPDHPSARSKFPKELGGAEDLGSLTLRGPYLRFNRQRLYPAPSFLLNSVERSSEKGEEKRTFVRLVPGEAVTCDLGRVKLPSPQEKIAGLKSTDGVYVTEAGMKRVLAGGIPADDEWYTGSRLWSMERRVGLERDILTRTAKDGLLYSTTHVRLDKDLELEVIEVGCPQGWSEQIPPMIRLGGEGRLAYVEIDEVAEDCPEFPRFNDSNSQCLYTVTLITPGDFHDVDYVSRHGPCGLPGELQTACIEKPLVIGGWNLEKGVSRPTKNLLPAGSTWFYVAEQDDLAYLRKIHGQCLGDSQAYGYSQILIGTWEGKT